jgi:SAM-dependent methyltransferase
VFAKEVPKEAYYPEVAFGGFSDADGKVAFFTRVHALLEPSHVVVDAGCGRGGHAEDPVVFRRRLGQLRGKCRRVIGIDLEPPNPGNPLIDEFRQIVDDRWPLDDESVDLCISVHVLEHVERPERFFSECARVLRPRGVLCLCTPNAFGYPALAARLIPNRWHAAMMRMLGGKSSFEDVFPTRYRCNTAGKIKSAMRRQGFAPCVYPWAGEPGYLRFSRISYFLGVLFHRYAPRVFMPTLLAFGRKVAPAAAQRTTRRRNGRAAAAGRERPAEREYEKAA